MILTKIIKTTKAEILVLGGLPEDAYGIKYKEGIMVYNKPTIIYLTPNSFKDALLKGISHHTATDIPPGKWEPLGFLKDISEHVAIELVDIWGATWDGKKYSYIDYLNKWYCENPKESLNSLVEANCKLKNKYGDVPKSLDEYVTRSEDSNGLSYIDPYQKALYDRYLEEYKSEQEKVFTNPFLLRKVNA